MKKSVVIFSIIFSFNVAAANDERATVLLERGTAKLTLADLDGRMSRMPVHDRAAFSAQPGPMANLMNRLLINRQLANEAKELGLDKDVNVQRDLQLAVEEVLAIHRLNALVAPEHLPNFEQLAREKYLADPESYAAGDKVVVEHILISTENRSADEALALAASIREKAVVPGADFGQLVKAHSDDPSKDQNEGEIVIARPGLVVPEFEAASRALKEVGEVSEPVLTEYGYHLIRLVEITPARATSFEDVKYQLIEQLRNDYIVRARENHRESLQSLEDTGDQSILRSLPERYGAQKITPRGASGN